jgi:hypothetical protein
MNAVRAFETSGISTPAIQSNNQHTRILNISVMETSSLS